MWRVFYCPDAGGEARLKYIKPALSFEQQADQLLSRRNLCAHHARLWNRELAIRPFVPDAKNTPEWHQPATPDNRRMFAVLTLLRWLLQKIAPQSHWPDRLRALLKSYPDVPQLLMGFPSGWETSPIWTEKIQ